jgi:hypothetical protein
MIGGTAMVLATIISNTFSATAVDEFNVLLDMESNKTIQLPNSVDLTKAALLEKLIANQIKLNTVLLELRQVYFNLTEQGVVAFEEDLENLGNLELSLRGQSEYYKKLWRDYQGDIIPQYGKEVYNVFRNIVATVGQIRKNVSNIVSIQSPVQITNDVQFEPSVAFTKLASKISQNTFNYH